MRSHLSTRPLTGPVQPLLPLAEAAARRGREVAFATGEPVLSELRQRGLQCFRAGPGYETRAEFDPRAREVEALASEERRVVFFVELFVGIESSPRAGLYRHRYVDPFPPSRPCGCATSSTPCPTRR